MRKALLLATLPIILLSCQERIPFQVDADYCFRHMLPLMQFSLEYPADLQTDPPAAGSRNLHYNTFFKADQTGIQTESITLSYLSLSPDSSQQDKDMEMMIGQLAEDYREAGFEMEDSFTGQAEFDGETYRVFRATGSIDKEDYGLRGKYRILVLLMTPKFDNNGLLVSFMARDDSPIQTYEDFARKGSIGTVWKTLKIEKPVLPERK